MYKDVWPRPPKGRERAAIAALTRLLKALVSHYKLRLPLLAPPRQLSRDEIEARRIQTSAARMAQGLPGAVGPTPDGGLASRGMMPGLRAMLVDWGSTMDAHGAWTPVRLGAFKQAVRRIPRSASGTRPLNNLSDSLILDAFRALDNDMDGQLSIADLQKQWVKFLTDRLAAPRADPARPRREAEGGRRPG